MNPADFALAAPGSVISTPARGELPSGDPVHFMFSIVQVEDIVNPLSLSRVPFSRPGVDGLYLWQDLPLPVLSLETLFGLEQPGRFDKGNRGMVVKTTGTPERWGHRAVIRIAPGSRLLNRVPVALPVQAVSVLPDRLVPAAKGVFEWEKGMLIVPDIDQILSGKLNHVFGRKGCIYGC